ncbi:hypothetical protein J6590_018915 [Homalodisca vitripennis]|nr:hypothetical protein J6590_018915 [Homalodisca vitripennis]
MCDTPSPPARPSGTPESRLHASFMRTGPWETRSLAEECGVLRPNIDRCPGPSTQTESLFACTTWPDSSSTTYLHLDRANL